VLFSDQNKILRPEQESPQEEIESESNLIPAHPHRIIRIVSIEEQHLPIDEW
jgi:hypothetical protein